MLVRLCKGNDAKGWGLIMFCSSELKASEEPKPQRAVHWSIGDEHEGHELGNYGLKKK